MAEQQPTSQQELAETIARLLVEKNLIRKDQQAELGTHIGGGDIKAENWLWLIETADKPDKPEPPSA